MAKNDKTSGNGEKNGEKQESDKERKARIFGYLVQKGFNVSEDACYQTLASRRPHKKYYWVNPDVGCVNQNWALLIDDTYKKCYYLFIIPENTIGEDELITRTEKGRQSRYEIEIDCDGNKDYKDRKSGYPFGRHLIATIGYDWFASESSLKTGDPGDGTRGASERIPGGANILYYGVPGAGKSQAVKDRINGGHHKENYPNMERVVFHPDYSYSDFVGQIMPKLIEDASGKDSRKLAYDFAPGPFTRILKDAVQDPANMYYLVIEEINRGNAPAIFGDVFQLLDREDDGSGSFAITNSDIYEYINKDGNGTPYENSEDVRIPSNLSILATMNTSDQNVFTLDTAFQRRWEMKMIENDVMKADNAGYNIGGTRISWGAFASVVNEKATASSRGFMGSEDKRLGHIS